MRIVRGFTPNWFTVGMGTGILAIDAYLLPGGPPWLQHTGTALWILNLALVSLFSILFIARAVIDAKGLKAVFHHPIQSMFFGAIPMAITTIVNGFFDMGPGLMGPEAFRIGAWLWGVNAVIAVLSVVVVPFLMFTRHDHQLETMTAVWLMPIVPAEVVAASGGLLIPHLTNLAAQKALFVGSVTLWAFSVPMAFLLLGVLFLRLALHKLPPEDMAISTWITLGTLGTGVMGLVLLGRDSQEVFPALGTGVETATIFAALILWGFGIWWLIQSILITAHYLSRRRLPFNMGWWGLTFPLGVFAAGTDLLDQALAGTIFGFAADVFFIMLATFWLVVAVRTVAFLIRGLRPAPNPDLPPRVLLDQAAEMG